jgi:hypothetical protein
MATSSNSFPSCPPINRATKVMAMGVDESLRLWMVKVKDKWVDGWMGENTHGLVDGWAGG